MQGSFGFARKQHMDLRKLKTLIDLVSESNVSELEITEAEGKVRIVKAANAPLVVHGAGQQVLAMPLQMPVAAPAGAGMPNPEGNQRPPTEQSTSVATESVAPVEATSQTIKSPMVGTFYLSSSPGAKPMAAVGDEIKVGQAVCIVEAMKIMNEIEAEVAGRVTKVLVENGQAVEFGQPLFVLE
jgi:acetyl-CoA carboxylase biotin carboxyl carrier protein